MIILIDTSTPETKLQLVDGSRVLLEDTWRADRELAEKIFSYLEEKMTYIDKNWNDISGIGIFKGPGSFTGLRIGAAVCNTVAHTKHIPIVGVSGDDWREKALQRLKNGENDKLVLPDYGRPARITSPRK